MFIPGHKICHCKHCLGRNTNRHNSRWRQFQVQTSILIEYVANVLIEYIANVCRRPRRDISCSSLPMSMRCCGGNDATDSGQRWQWDIQSWSTHGRWSRSLDWRQCHSRRGRRALDGVPQPPNPSRSLYENNRWSEVSGHLCDKDMLLVFNVAWCRTAMRPVLDVVSQWTQAPRTAERT